MADRNKFEEMLERLINEDKTGAEELFHEIVVEKSRDIYEGLLENDLEEVADEEVDEATDEEVDESDEEVDEATEEEVDESDEEVDENFDLDEFEVEADDDMGGDPADDMMGDIEDAVDGDDEGEDEGEEGDMEDRVEDLEDALDDLKAEFEKMMAGDEGGEDDAEDDMEAGDEEEAPEEEALNFGEAEEETDEAVEVEETKEPKSDIDIMKEYVEKVTHKQGEDNKAKSPVAGANDMGGDASNLVQGGEESGRSADSAKEEDAGNVNKPGGKASKSMKAAPKGSEKGAADNSKSVIGK